MEARERFWRRLIFSIIFSSTHSKINKNGCKLSTNAEFYTLVIRRLTELRERIDGLNENFSKETGNIMKQIESIKKSE